ERVAERHQRPLHRIRLRLLDGAFVCLAKIGQGTGAEAGSLAHHVSDSHPHLAGKADAPRLLAVAVLDQLRRANLAHVERFARPSSEAEDPVSLGDRVPAFDVAHRSARLCALRNVGAVERLLQFGGLYVRESHFVLTVRLGAPVTRPAPGTSSPASICALMAALSGWRTSLNAPCGSASMSRMLTLSRGLPTLMVASGSTSLGRRAVCIRSSISALMPSLRRTMRALRASRSAI